MKKIKHLMVLPALTFCVAIHFTGYAQTNRQTEVLSPDGHLALLVNRGETIEIISKLKGVHVLTVKNPGLVIDGIMAGKGQSRIKTRYVNQVQEVLIKEKGR